MKYIKAAEIQSLLDEPKPIEKIFGYLSVCFCEGANTVWANKFASRLAIWQISKTEGLSHYVSVKVDH